MQANTTLYIHRVHLSTSHCRSGTARNTLLDAGHRLPGPPTQENRRQRRPQLQQPAHNGQHSASIYIGDKASTCRWGGRQQVGQHVLTDQRRPAGRQSLHTTRPGLAVK